MNIFGSIAILASFLVAFGSAQQTYTINPDSVPLATRDAWCESEIAQCPSICLQTSAHSSVTKSNQCDAKTLTYSCVCSNGLSPNVSEYSLTLPYYICQEWGNQCVTACGSDNSCASACRDDHPCGAQNPTRVNTSTTAPGAHPATATKSQAAYTGFADGTHSGASCLCKPFKFTPTQMTEVLAWVGIILAMLFGLAVGL